MFRIEILILSLCPVCCLNFPSNINALNGIGVIIVVYKFKHFIAGKIITKLDITCCCISPYCCFQRFVNEPLRELIYSIGILRSRYNVIYNGIIQLLVFKYEKIIVSDILICPEINSHKDAVKRINAECTLREIKNG